MLGPSGKPKALAMIVVILIHRAFYQELIYSARYNFSRGGRCSMYLIEVVIIVKS
jgi:hypothetical protein